MAAESGWTQARMDTKVSWSVVAREKSIAATCLPDQESWILETYYWLKSATLRLELPANFTPPKAPRILIHVLRMYKRRSKIYNQWADKPIDLFPTADGAWEGALPSDAFRLGEFWNKRRAHAVYALCYTSVFDDRHWSPAIFIEGHGGWGPHQMGADEYINHYRLIRQGDVFVGSPETSSSASRADNSRAASTAPEGRHSGSPEPVPEHHQHHPAGPPPGTGPWWCFQGDYQSKRPHGVGDFEHIDAYSANIKKLFCEEIISSHADIAYRFPVFDVERDGMPVRGEVVGLFHDPEQGVGVKRLRHSRATNALSIGVVSEDAYLTANAGFSNGNSSSSTKFASICAFGIVPVITSGPVQPGDHIVVTESSCGTAQSARALADQPGQDTVWPLTIGIAMNLDNLRPKQATDTPASATSAPSAAAPGSRAQSPVECEIDRFCCQKAQSLDTFESAKAATSIAQLDQDATMVYCFVSLQHLGQAAMATPTRVAVASRQRRIGSEDFQTGWSSQPDSPLCTECSQLSSSSIASWMMAVVVILLLQTFAYQFSIMLTLTI